MSIELRVTCAQIIPPVYSVYPVNQANQVFLELSQDKIHRRAVFRLFPETSDDDVVESDAATPLRAGCTIVVQQ